MLYGTFRLNKHRINRYRDLGLGDRRYQNVNDLLQIISEGRISASSYYGLPLGNPIIRSVVIS